jgi:hypothetical protein
MDGLRRRLPCLLVLEAEDLAVLRVPVLIAWRNPDCFLFRCLYLS